MTTDHEVTCCHVFLLLLYAIWEKKIIMEEVDDSDLLFVYNQFEKDLKDTNLDDSEGTCFCN